MQYSQEDSQQLVAQRRNRNSFHSMSTSMIPPPTFGHNDDRMGDTSRMVGGDTLDDIILQNNKEIQRRRSLQRDWRSSLAAMGHDGSGLGGFPYAQHPNAEDPNLRRQSTGGLGMGGYDNIGSRLNMADPQMYFTTSPTHADTTGFPDMSREIAQGVPGYDSMDMTGLADGSTTMNGFSSPILYQPFNPNFMISGPAQPELMSHAEGVASLDENSILAGVPTGMDMDWNIPEYSSSVSPVKTDTPIFSTQELPSIMPPTAAPTTAEGLETGVKPESGSPYQGTYPPTQFDMLGALLKVALRKDPEFNIGKVDLSCAFAVCDMTLEDYPLIYVSSVFERLTGYSKHEILGRNCRFLQSPDGSMVSGAHRGFVDDESVRYLRSRMAQWKEAQRSLINYRKGGQPFMNLLTMIPITGEDDKELKYYVGFQIDVAENPTAVEGHTASGRYTVDYRHGASLQRWRPQKSTQMLGDYGQTISHDEVSAVLSSFQNNFGLELVRMMWDRVLLENTDDVVHVLSLQGLFLYVSPSCRQVLEYDVSELMGITLSSICHPSDIVSATRGLKDASVGASVTIVFRIRRKESGYTWFESRGSLCTEQGKGRKFIVLVGRVRPTYALSRHDIEAAGGIGDNEIWSKISASGMFLFVSSNAQTLLDQSSDDLVGTSFQTLIRPESRVLFGRALENARAGNRIAYKHDISTRKGSVMQARTILYPGDASEGRKASFLVVQTRILKNPSKTVTSSVSSQSNSAPMSPLDAHPSEEGIVLHRPTANISQDGMASGSDSSGSGAATQTSGIRVKGDPGLGPQDNIFEELEATRPTNWQFEVRRMQKANRILAEELASLLSNKKKRKRRKGGSNVLRDCANCHTRVTPEWRRGPSGQRDLCNSCGLRWAKEVNRSGLEQSSASQNAAKSRA